MPKQKRKQDVEGRLQAYYLRSIPISLWEAFRVKARQEGHSMREMLIRLMEKYVGSK